MRQNNSIVSPIKKQVVAVERGNLSSRVYEQMRELLISGQYMPNERIRISEAAEMFGTSDTPVREALLRLVSEHALEMHAAKLISVPPLSLSRYIEIRTVRLALEVLAAELATPHIGVKELKELARVNQRFAEADRKHDYLAQLRYNREFHFAIYNRCGLQTLISLIESMWTSMGPLLRAFYHDAGSGYEAAADHHAGLIEALSLGNAVGAGQAIRKDILSAAPAIEKFLREQEAREAKSAA